MTIYTFDHWRNVPSALWPWPHFTPAEMSCKRTGAVMIDTTFMDMLTSLRQQLDFPFIINSGFRTIKHDEDIGGAGVHPIGCAVDIRVYGYWAHELLSNAGSAGFTGIGVKQHGEYKDRYIHLDSIEEGSLTHPRPWTWTYEGE